MLSFADFTRGNLSVFIKHVSGKSYGVYGCLDVTQDGWISGSQGFLRDTPNQD